MPIIKKFTEVIDLCDWEIDTPSGWQPIKKVCQTIEYDVWRVEFYDGTVLECADTHILFDKYGFEVFAKDLRRGSLVKSREGHRIVSSVTKTNRTEQLYDVEIDSEDHLYYSNDLVSHNTTTAAAYILHELMFNEDATIAVLANKADTAREILDRIKKMLEELPIYMQPGVVEWNKSRIELGNGCKAIAAASSSSSIRGKSISILYLDEMAFLQNDVEFFASTYPVITSGKKTKVIITSTPNGMNLFYKMWIDAIEKRSKFIPVKYLWNAHPERDEAWKEDTLGNMSPEKFAVEFEGEFMGSSNTLISGSTLQRLTFTEPEEVINDSFYVYEYPKEGHSYVACLDVCEGTGNDYSVINIIDVTEKVFNQVAVYRNNMIQPVKLAEVARGILTKYNNALCIVETNSIGVVVFDALLNDYEYENMLTTVKRDGDNYVSESAKSSGLRQTKKTKIIGCSMLKNLIESQTLIVRDYNTIQELSSFVKKGNTYQAEKRRHDDIAMCLVMFSWFVDQPYFSELTDQNVRKLILEREDDHCIYGFVVDGTEEENDEFDPSLLMPVSPSFQTVEESDFMIV